MEKTKKEKSGSTETKGGKKRFIIIIAAAFVMVVAVVAFLLFRKKVEEYRLLKIYEVEGDANVDRTDIGSIKPYSNMVLESGDVISLNTGMMTIQADEDKYIYLEEGTQLKLMASGTGNNSKTKIELMKGAITNDIRTKMAEDESYEINTPNSTMSVRGTIFRVWIYEEEGVKYTRVSVFDGEVETRLIYKNGTMADESVPVGKGKEVIIYEDSSTTDYLTDPTDIDYDSLPEEVLRLLKDVNDSGREASITNPEIKVILEGPYNVAFIYDGKVFGTQTVKKGEKAVVPALSPAATGGWDFDFDTPIEKHTEIHWK